MKIKIKNNKNIKELKESQLLELDNPAIQENNKSTAANLYKALCAKQFIQDRKKEDVLINVVVPDKLYTNLNILKSPIDIQNLMTSAITNKSEKTRDFEKWGMVDPIATYNSAEDCCAAAFKNFNSKIQLAKSKDEQQLNKENVASEGILIKNTNVLNEITTAAATAAGVQSGLAISHGINLINCFGAGLVSTVGTTIAVWGSLFAGLCVGTHEISKYAGYKLTDATPNGTKQDGKEITDPNKDILSNITKSTTLDFNNVSPAIETYINDIMQSIRDLLQGLSPNMLEEFNKISKYITNYMAVSSDKAENFIKENSEALKEQEKIRHDKEIIDLNKQKTALEKQSNFITKMLEAASAEQQIRKDEFVKINAIINYYKTANSKDYEKKRMLEDALEEGGIKKVIVTYTTSIEKSSKKTQETPQLASAAYLGNNSNSLNEAAEELAVGNKPDLPLDTIYKGLYTDLKSNFDALCAKFDKKQMTNLEETKENMKLLIDEADKTIKDRIEKITKSSQTSSGNESGLTKAAVQFLAGHPLEADNLLEIWSRHLVDLKQRMNARIKIMTDTGNSTRTLGWTISFLQNVMPDLISRLLTYRYGYQVLAKKGMYTYNTAKIKKDMELYNDTSTGLKYIYEKSPRAKLIFILNNYSGDYTNTGKSCISPDENGKFTLNENYLAYGSLLAKKLKPNLSDENIIKMGVDLANINKTTEGAEYLYNGLYGALTRYPAMSLFPQSDNFEIEFDNLINAFKMNDEIKALKDTILMAYNKIKNIGNNVLSNLNVENAKNIAQSFYIIANNNPIVIYNIYKKNEGDITKLLAEFKAAAEKNDNDNKTLNKIRQDIHKIFSNIDFSNLNETDENIYITTIKNMFESKYNNDYYSYIISFADRTKLGIPHLFSKNGIKQSCAIFPVLVELASSGILSYVEDEDKSEKVDTTKIDELIKEIKDVPCAKLAAYNALSSSTGTSNNPTFEECKKILIYHQNEYIKSTIEEYNKISNDVAAKAESNKSKYVLDLQGDTNNLNNIITKIDKNHYENYDSNSLILDLSTYSIKDTSIQFNKLSDNDKLIICNNLLTAIKNSKDTEEYKQIVKSIDDAIKIADE